MDNYDDMFRFYDTSDDNSDNSTNGFDYNSISGLGESDYENEDIFSNEVSENTKEDNSYNSYPDSKISEASSATLETDTSNTWVESSSELDNLPTEDVNVEENIPNNNTLDNNLTDENTIEEVNNDTAFTEIDSNPVPYNEELIQTSDSDSISNVEDNTIDNNENTNIESNVDEKENTEVSSKKIELSDTPIEELKDLTKYKEEEIESTDIDSLFEKVSVNVKDASDIFRKNTDLKAKIDSRFEELKKLQSEIENSKKKQMDEINNYKAEVYNKLNEKKQEIEKRLNLLKESQVKLDNDKKEFEQYRKKEQENIESVQKEVQQAYDERREELTHIEDILRKQKDSLDEERNQLSLDKIQYESDKNALANNLLKFNDLVGTFTSGVNEVKDINNEVSESSN
ncbi:MAG: hypothetical protein Q4E75_00370 [bacterium]|nr:hypothetical protein [bacterium]